MDHAAATRFARRQWEGRRLNYVMGSRPIGMSLEAANARFVAENPPPADYPRRSTSD